MSSDPHQDRVEAIGEQLRSKIASKFAAATFLAGFALTLLGGQILALWQSTALPNLFASSVGAISSAFVLFIFSIIRLDELTMPKRFWPEDSNALTSPLDGYLTDEDLWALQKRMVFYWQRLTITATGITAAGVVLLLLPLPLKEVRSVQGETLLWTAGGCAIAGLYCYAIRHYAERKFGRLVRPED